jgi:hypothetical protein
MGTPNFDPAATECRSWNAGRLVGAKRLLKLRDVWPHEDRSNGALPLRRG